MPMDGPTPPPLPTVPTCADVVVVAALVCRKSMPFSNTCCCGTIVFSREVGVPPPAPVEAVVAVLGRRVFTVIAVSDVVTAVASDVAAAVTTVVKAVPALPEPMVPVPPAAPPPVPALLPPSALTAAVVVAIAAAAQAAAIAEVAVAVTTPAAAAVVETVATLVDIAADDTAVAVTSLVAVQTFCTFFLRKSYIGVRSYASQWMMESKGFGFAFYSVFKRKIAVYRKYIT